MSKHKNRIASLMLIITLAGLSAGSSFAESYSEPSDDYLHYVVQQWTAKSSIGNLRAAEFADDDIEVRIWSGFGLLGSSGGVLSRRDGHWTVTFLELDRHFAGATNEIAASEGLLPPCVVEAMADRCRVETTEDIRGNAREYSLECARVMPSVRHENQEDLSGLWDVLTESGILELPPTIERDWLIMDAHSYVIEVRVGDQYRATVAEHADETLIDKRIHQIVIAFDSVLDKEFFGGYHQ